MKSISLRDFQHNGAEYLNELPLILTRYNLPVAIISSYETQNVDTIPVLEEKSVDTSKIEIFQELKKSIENGVIPVREPIVDTIKGTFKGKCKAPGCFQDAVGMGKIWEDGGVYELAMCQKHINRSLKEV